MLQRDSAWELCRALHLNPQNMQNNTPKPIMDSPKGHYFTYFWGLGIRWLGRCRASELRIWASGLVGEGTVATHGIFGMMEVAYEL